jgi:ubiquinone/menaquinone biosynthesis C-methylase UbiE
VSQPPQRTAYDVADRYDAAYFADLAGRYRRRNRFARRRIANVLSLLPPLRGRRVLDIGCGMGTFAFESARAGAAAVGVDLAEAALSEAGRVARSEGVAASFVRADAVRLPFGDAAFDIAIAADLTEHLDAHTLDGVARELARVVTAGGSLVVYTPAPSHWLERLRTMGWLEQEPSHIGLRDADTLAHAFAVHGFALRQRRFLPSHLPVLELAEKAAARWVPLLRRRIGLVLERTTR